MLTKNDRMAGKNKQTNEKNPNEQSKGLTLVPLHPGIPGRPYGPSFPLMPLKRSKAVIVETIWSEALTKLCRNFKQLQLIIQHVLEFWKMLNQQKRLTGRPGVPGKPG